TGTTFGNAGSAFPDPSRATVAVKLAAPVQVCLQIGRASCRERVGVPPAAVPVTLAESCTCVPIGSEAPATVVPPVSSSPSWIAVVLLESSLLASNGSQSLVDSLDRIRPRQ